MNKCPASPDGGTLPKRPISLLPILSTESWTAWLRGRTVSGGEGKRLGEVQLRLWLYQGGVDPTGFVRDFVGNPPWVTGTPRWWAPHLAHWLPRESEHMRSWASEHKVVLSQYTRHQIIKWYNLNLLNFICQLYLSQAGKQCSGSSKILWWCVARSRRAQNAGWISYLKMRQKSITSTLY